MKILIVILVSLAMAAGIAQLAVDNPGFVLLSREPYTIKLPLALFVLIVVLVFLLLYFLMNFLLGILKTRNKIKEWQQGNNQNKAQFNSMAGFAGLIEGDWVKAEKVLMSKIEHNQSPLMSYLGAAYAAQQQNNKLKRDEYLDKALSLHPKQSLAISLTRARLHIGAGELAEARALLEQVHRSKPKNQAVAKLLSDIYHQLEEWAQLVERLPQFTKLGIYSSDELPEIEKNVYRSYLALPDLFNGEGSRIAHAWKELPRSRKKNPKIIASYAQQLINVGQSALAEKILRKALTSAWDGELVELYGLSDSGKIDGQIKFAESFLREHPEDADLMLTMGRLYRRNEEFDKACEMMRLAISSGRHSPAYEELGGIQEQMGEIDEARESYRQGLVAQGAQLTNPPSHEEPSPGKLIVLEQPHDYSEDSVLPGVSK